MKSSLAIQEDTIAAIATPLGEGGLAVIRISGSQAIRIAESCFRPARKTAPSLEASPTHTLYLGHIYDGDQVIDEVLLSVMRAPRTFTAEDIVEISCHGGVLPAQLILQTLLNRGARLAQPGEFTRRAFLNGRIDLTQAEAVADIIHSRTELALGAANQQLAGALSRQINSVRDLLMHALAHVEAYLDFPEEDIAPATQDELKSQLRATLDQIEALLSTAYEGQVLRHGIRAAIIGRPNAGKSSLLNLFLGHDRAIVSPIPGTTRDTIEETANIRGIPVIFIDTAGLRETPDAIEQEGVRRSLASLERAELVLHVLDNSVPSSDEDFRWLASTAPRKRILTLNKTDLPRQFDVSILQGEIPHEISCATGNGIETLKDAIVERVWSGKVGSEMHEVMINSRHQTALQTAREAARLALQSLQNRESLEFVALELRNSAHALGEIVGKTSTEDLLDIIFSQFCIGK